MSRTEHERIQSYRPFLKETSMSRFVGRMMLLAVAISVAISLPAFARGGGGRGGGGMRGGGGGGMRGGGGGGMRGGGGGFSQSPSFSAPRTAGSAGYARP